MTRGKKRKLPKTSILRTDVFPDYKALTIQVKCGSEVLEIDAEGEFTINSYGDIHGLTTATFWHLKLEVSDKQAWRFQDFAKAIASHKDSARP